ncbi:hypothetical protein INS49_010950 [Diaporthe citri]|uniref:uncharacterized protein n=1 Tax=Diaporthe citri TaxID=83186 RepID=UPI001C81A5A7|nr:uncharacterized protein INS49_010950 [Diaporthe citri]KAG6359897.1 hypothetical protein INS49_010950 [Diaporthe citri]
MQFSIKTVLTIAIGMAALAAPAEGISCCAFSDCTVCADYGHPIDSCDFCQDPYGVCC